MRRQKGYGTIIRLVPNVPESNDPKPIMPAEAPYTMDIATPTWLEVILSL